MFQQTTVHKGPIFCEGKYNGYLPSRLEETLSFHRWSDVTVSKWEVTINGKVERARLLCWVEGYCTVVTRGKFEKFLDAGKLSHNDKTGYVYSRNKVTVHS